ncbi:MAG: citrate/2-methylcitrate synthase [Acidimicrobiales bacterium]
MPRNLLTADQAAARLGVKVETVYAYVSRGALTRTVAEDGRTSRFDPAEVDELAQRGRPRRDRRRAGSVEVTLATGITKLADDRLAFRGHDVADLTRTATFEAVAELLWTAELPSSADAAVWTVPDDARRLAAAVTAPLPADAPAIERLAVVTAALAGADPLRVDRRPAAVARVGRRLLTTFPTALPAAVAPDRSRRRGTATRTGGGNRATGAHRRVAAALWPALSPLPATRPRVRVLDAALVLLADHELATSTLAARVAASTRADPYAVVLAGLGAVAGPRHGTAAAASHRLFLDAEAGGSAERALAAALESSPTPPGFGHPVYRTADPRATVLLDRLASICPRRAAATIDGVLAAGARLDAGPATVDAALGAFAYATQMPVGATDAVFAVARTAGWIAHALEEYGEAPLRFRARAVYTGE